MAQSSENGDNLPVQESQPPQPFARQFMSPNTYMTYVRRPQHIPIELYLHVSEGVTSVRVITVQESQPPFARQFMSPNTYMTYVRRPQHIPIELDLHVSEGVTSVRVITGAGNFIDIQRGQ